MMIRYIGLLVLIKIIAGAKLTNCPSSNIRFEKILGLRPPSNSHPLLLFQREDNSSRPVTTECISKCHSNDQCRSFVLYYNISSCFWFRTGSEGYQELETVVDSKVAWFTKVCLEVKNCTKLWVVERIPGAVLIGENKKIIPYQVSRTDCQQHCLNETEFICRSVKYKIVQLNAGPNAIVRGTCVLSNADRHILPNSYTVANYDEEYFENQCAQRSNSSNAFCAYEEYDNVTLAHGDILFERKSKEDCLDLCEKSTAFNCRGYSVIQINKFTISNCILHSEDSKVHGPRLLRENLNSTYFEKAPCINISVACSETYMTVLYYPELDFTGRVYMQGYSDHPQCFAVGQGRSLVTLKLPLLSRQCGITQANGPLNRTLLAGTMVLQYNNLIQRQGDRIFKVGCIFGNESKVLVGTGVTISSSLPNKGSTLVSTTSNKTVAPHVEMRVVDLSSNQEVSDTQIGQELQLIIEVRPPNDSIGIWASHLVAMTEKSDESIFLLDDRGCPTNLNIFPALQREVTNTSKRLTATFQAFKFASSPIVRFSVIIQFCPGDCPPIDCGHNILSFGRRRRDAETRIETVNGTKILKVNRQDFEQRSIGSTVINEMPLEFIMLVRDPRTKTDKLILGESKSKILIAGYDYASNELCLDYSIAIGLIVLWILVQIIFIVCCVVLIRRYKRYYEHECTRLSLEELHKNFGYGFSNLENRRVHWADHTDIT